MSSPHLLIISLASLLLFPAHASAQRPPTPPERAAVLHVEGMRSYMSRDYPQAIAYWEASLASATSGEVYHYLAKAYVEVGELESAEQAASLARAQRDRPLTRAQQVANDELIERIASARAATASPPISRAEDNHSPPHITIDELDGYDDREHAELLARQEDQARRELQRARVSRMYAEAERTRAEAELLYGQANAIKAETTRAQGASEATSPEELTDQGEARSAPRPSFFYAGTGAIALGTVGLGSALFLNNKISTASRHPDFGHDPLIEEQMRRDRALGVGALLTGSALIATGASLIYFGRGARRAVDHTETGKAGARLHLSPHGLSIGGTF